jgi:hypothetical protein
MDLSDSKAETPVVFVWINPPGLFDFMSDYTLIGKFNFDQFYIKKL